MKEQQVEAYAKLKLQTLGLDTKGWRFRYTDSTKFFGCTLYKRKVILLSRPYVRVNSRQAIYDALQHELAHALVLFSKDHGSAWQTACKRLGGSGLAKMTKETVRPL